jgi:hypothetical protein
VYIYIYIWLRDTRAESDKFFPFEDRNSIRNKEVLLQIDVAVDREDFNAGQEFARPQAWLLKWDVASSFRGGNCEYFLYHRRQEAVQCV